MYRDDLAATYARVEQLQRELTDASSQGVQDKQHIAALTAQLAQMQQMLVRMGNQVPYPQYGYPSYVFPSRSGTILTLGILSLVLCHVLGPIAWSMGNEEMRRIDMGQAPPMGRGQATAGRICGIIGSVLLIVGGIFVVAMLAVASSAHHGYY